MSRLWRDVRLVYRVWRIRRALGQCTNVLLLWMIVRRTSAVLLFAALVACGLERPTCSGVSLGDDLILTAQHCAPGVAGTPGQLARPEVRLGDELTIDARAGCAGTRTGRVIELDPVDGWAILSTYACPGNSGAPVRTAEGHLVGLLVRMRLPSHDAVVELF